MDSADRAIERVLEITRMSNEAAREEILRSEEWAKENLALGEITQEEAWDMFFGLLHECDERGLLEDRRRILAQIDTDVYKPFESKNPEIRFLAMLRARVHGLVKSELN